MRDLYLQILTAGTDKTTQGEFISPPPPQRIVQRTDSQMFSRQVCDMFFSLFATDFQFWKL